MRGSRSALRNKVDDLESLSQIVAHVCFRVVAYAVVATGRAGSFNYKLAVAKLCLFSV